MSQIFREGLLDGQVAIVTGGGSGIGRATALELASLGMRVAVFGRRVEPLEETCALDPSGRCTAVVCDIREEDHVDAAVAGVVEREGRIDLLVNNAGGQFLTPAELITPKGFRTVIRLNLEGTWLMTHACATKAMIPAGGGKVVSITMTPHTGLPGMTHSSASRAGMESMMKTLSIEWARFNIRLNAIAPGIVGTDTFLTKYPKQFVEGAAETVPLQRLGTPEQIAWMVAQLASPAGDYTTGSVITIDGARDNHIGPWPPERELGEDGLPAIEVRRPRD
ncbi:putative 2,4-dienoyl-CoA reductase [Paraconexibacter sp. AEG42_29]|uniref:Peroxisomal trans-2-enoyl-CoA reductase n=1 Tax=Paraconexibacter sp. AEG42_29 TaxID=2997339 RepID=A0AAU7ARU5_9ACTN